MEWFHVAFIFFFFSLSSGYQEKQERKKAMAVGRRALGCCLLGSPVWSGTGCGRKWHQHKAPGPREFGRWKGTYQLAWRALVSQVTIFYINWAGWAVSTSVWGLINECIETSRFHYWEIVPKDAECLYCSWWQCPDESIPRRGKVRFHSKEKKTHSNPWRTPKRWIGRFQTPQPTEYGKLLIFRSCNLSYCVKQCRRTGTGNSKRHSYTQKLR